MAKQTSAVTFTGKFGNMVGMKGFNGTYNARIYLDGDQISDKKTDEQVYNRARLALAAKVAGMLGLMGEQVNVANGIKPTRRGTLIRQIMGYIEDAVTGPELSPSLPLVRMPKGSMSVENRIAVTAPTAITSGSIQFTPQCSADGDATMQRTIVALLVYNKTTEEWRSNVQVFAATAPNTSIRVYIPAEWAGSTCECYGYSMGILTNPSVTGASATMGGLVGSSDAFSIAVDSNNVAYGNLLFTQVCSYHVSENISPIGG